MAVKIRAAKAAKLKNLEVTKVALVGAGSNPKANIALFKSKKDKTGETPASPVEKTTYNELRTARAASNAIWKIYDRVYDLQDAIYMSAEQPEDIRTSIREFGADVDNILDELASGSYEKADPNAIRQAVIEKMAEFASRIAPEEDAVKKTIKKAATAATPPVKKNAPKPLEELTKEELIAQVKALQAKTAPVEKQEDPDEDDDEDQDEDDEEVTEVDVEIDEDIKKALPKPVLALISKLTATTNTALKTASAAQALAKAADEKRQRSEYVTRARKELAHLPGTAEENGDMIMNLYKMMPKEVADAVVKSLAAGDAALAALGEETGTDAAVTGSALEQLNTLAKTRADGSGGKLTFEQAFSKVCKENTDLWKQYRKETRERSLVE